ncbi:hypothetical protein DLAC_06248 [Tieghemostelium lacteum]|uniref:Defective in cullin neddylation protein n=1 Tax=Tieghemostelium lacteum TaxID=361077 RepID=A0A151ZHS8_TIELA|nr:hypothetical protein DLAC_06248 [Tieghemostelium lacteum]|eukprot:KYQ93542.1 hypothetical protein DLAC_06248 [Tieghemostelium lacteum]
MTRKTPTKTTGTTKSPSMMPQFTIQQQQQQTQMQQSHAINQSRKRKNSEEKVQVIIKKASNPLTNLQLMFEKYKDDDEYIGPEGIDRFCNALGFPPASIQVLILAWKIGAQKMGYFSKTEFIDGLEQLKCFDLDTLKQTLVQLTLSTKYDSIKFLELYKYAFTFASEVESKKSVDIESAAEMLSIILPEGPHTTTFVEFLKDRTHSYKVLNRDQWLCFLEFSKTVKSDLSNYDESDAWPMLFDSYSTYKLSSQKIQPDKK